MVKLLIAVAISMTCLTIIEINVILELIRAANGTGVLMYVVMGLVSSLFAYFLALNLQLIPKIGALQLKFIVHIFTLVFALSGYFIIKNLLVKLVFIT